MHDLHVLPRVRDSLSYLYVEHCRIDQEAKAIAVHDANGKTPVPCASLTTLLLGPGTNITHAAIRALADNGCLVLWTGEEGVRMYAQGMGETRSARNLLLQARLWADPAAHLEVVMRMYRMRFSEELAEGLTLQQIRGREGVRVREAYARASRETGIPWRGRSYRSDDWSASDPVNRALSSANSCLYGVCHAAIVSLGYSPGLGFVHTGKMLSFVWDVADLYKADITIPLAFETAAEGSTNLETRVRRACRDRFNKSRMLQRIAPDITYALTGAGRRPAEGGSDIDRDPELDVDLALPGGLWDPEVGAVQGGVNQADVATEPDEEG
ncbi:MAG TPA: type I-E CRISPR-associated endonuclease Cas1e [Thermomicrobiaceae bacterium]|nr:type I-E CRISPR-associated endonuclease Cas1e [Thermomicrobiaceae bacterium]